MEHPEKNTETFIQTFKRAIITTTIIALILFLLRVFPTLVLLQVGLDVETSAVCIAVLWFGQTNIYLTFCC